VTYCPAVVHFSWQDASAECLERLTCIKRDSGLERGVTGSGVLTTSGKSSRCRRFGERADTMPA